MSFMDKFQAGIEKVLVPIATKLNAQRHICAVRCVYFNIPSYNGRIPNDIT